jgi:hypothetical protein
MHRAARSMRSFNIDPYQTKKQEGCSAVPI